MAIEAGKGTAMRGYLVMGGMGLLGGIDPLAEQITLDTTRLVPLPPQAQVKGMAYEALTIVDNKLLAIYAANGAGLLPVSAGLRLQPGTRPAGDDPVSQHPGVADGMVWGAEWPVAQQRQD